MSDRIAVMNQGRLVQVGTPTEVYELPTHRFVAEFMGHSNLVQGVVRSCSGGFGVLDAATGPLEGRCLAPLPAGTPALVSVRYEKVDVVPRSGGAGLPGRIVDIRYMGATVRIETAVGADGFVIHSDMPGARAAALAVGQDVSVSWPREGAVLIQS
jgi:ABC-type Fe3+/spermidine/putrescine transport system ATPase subunit